MPKKLPARPNLEHLRTQAKTLLTALRRGDPAAAQAFAQHLPVTGVLSTQKIREHGFRLCDAQAVIARKTGFAAWPGLARHVDSLRRMEGTWKFSALEIDGQRAPEVMIANSQLLIDGDRFRMESREAIYEGIFTIDIEAEPPRIDIDFNEGPEAGNRCEGIFRFERDQLTFCLGLVGSSRPRDFATTQGSGHALEVLVRANPARPANVNGGTPSAEEQCPAPKPDAGAFEARLTPTHEKLLGEWEALELVTSGTPLQPSYLPFGSRTHSGIETKVVFGGQTMLHAKVRINESTTPVEVDYLNLAGKSRGLISQGLFRWDGDVAVFCVAAAESPRPTDFTSKPGSGRTLSRWKRKG